MGALHAWGALNVLCSWFRSCLTSLNLFVQEARPTGLKPAEEEALLGIV